VWFVVQAVAVAKWDQQLVENGNNVMRPFRILQRKGAAVMRGMGPIRITIS
jgi:hypothetical protein